MSNPRISVVKEDSTGRNVKFIDNSTGDLMSRAKFVREIRQGNYDDYHIRNINGIDTPVSNPDKSEKNNLG